MGRAGELESLSTCYHSRIPLKGKKGDAVGGLCRGNECGGKKNAATGKKVDRRARQKNRLEGWNGRIDFLALT